MCVSSQTITNTSANTHFDLMMALKEKFEAVDSFGEHVCLNVNPANISVQEKIVCILAANSC